MSSEPTPLRIINDDGESVLTTYAVGLVLGVHADDISPAIVDNLPQKWIQQAYHRIQEARAHDPENPDTWLPVFTYWARTEHNADIHIDQRGQIWMA